MKLHVVSLGCQMSVADGEEMSGPFVDRGFSLTDEIEEADAALINTCTVRQHAEDRAVSLIGRLRPWKEERPERFLIVAGCAAERLGGWIRQKFPFVDLVVGAKSIEQYPEILNEALNARFDWAGENAGTWNADLAAAQDSPVSSYLTVMRGCNYSCSYCIVPSVRGREIYRPFDTIIDEARRKVAAGTKEIILLGQTVNSYHCASDSRAVPAGEENDSSARRAPRGADFAGLLRALDALPGLERIRFMSPHPYYLTDRMIAAMAECPKVCRHLHLPLQSGSDRILKAMRRNYTVQSYAAAVEKLRRTVPGIELTTDVIAGFPGETEDDFRQTLDFLDKIDPCAAYCFKFSPRPGTEAAELADPVSPEVIEERHGRLLERMDARTQRHLKSWTGREVQVLLETQRQGRTEYHFNAKLTEPAGPGETVSAVVIGASRTSLEASLKNQLRPST